MDLSRKSFMTFCVLYFTYVHDVGSQFYAAKPMSKTWWAKRIDENIFVAGRLSEIQVKYASEDGFKSIISVYNHVKTGYFGPKKLIPTEKAKDLANRLCGIQFEILFDVGDNEDDGQLACWRNIESIKKFDKLYSSLEKPVLLYSNTGYSAAFIALSWLMWQNKLGKVTDVAYQLSARDFYKRAAGLGYDFSKDETIRGIVAELSGEEKVENPAMLDLTLPDWHKHYWWVKPVERNWYIAGQIWNEHLGLIKKLGTDVVVNSRMGLTAEDPDSGDITETQEEVNLLNVNEDCWTYCPGGRQSKEQLLANRIDPNKLGEYIHQGNPRDVNYMPQNPLEFGDDVGYNEMVQRLAIEDVPLEYIHTPLEDCDEMKFKLYQKTWREAHDKGNVLLHCRTGCRAVVPTLLTLGLILEKDVDWAIEKAKLVGYDFSKVEDPGVWDLLESVLGNNKSKSNTKTEL